MAHQAAQPQPADSGGELVRDRDGVRRRQSPPAHAGVELDVHGERRGGAGAQPVVRLARRDRDLDVMHLRLLAGNQRPHHQHRDVRQPLAQGDGLLMGRDAQPGGSRRERRGAHVCSAVAVAVGLDDGPQLGRRRGVRQEAAVVGHRAEVDRHGGAGMSRRRVGYHSSASARTTSAREITPTTAPASSTTGRRLTSCLIISLAASCTESPGATLIGIGGHQVGRRHAKGLAELLPPVVHPLEEDHATQDRDGVRHLDVVLDLLEDQVGLPDHAHQLPVVDDGNAGHALVGQTAGRGRRSPSSVGSSARRYASSGRRWARLAFSGRSSVGEHPW